MKTKDVLELPMRENDADASTVRDYFYKLLLTMWREGEGFSGKRPFGDSGWEFDLYETLVRHGVCPGEVDEDGCLDSVDTKVADVCIFNCIQHIFWGKT